MNNERNVDKEIHKIEESLDRLTSFIYEAYEEPLYLEEANDEDTRED